MDGKCKGLAWVLTKLEAVTFQRIINREIQRENEKGNALSTIGSFFTQCLIVNYYHLFIGGSSNLIGSHGSR